jgi:deazaflavin-dependent oxidoreductase (nitroreductase family)
MAAWSSPLMPLPRGLARFNRRVTNPVARRLGRRLPGFAIVHHRGRSSGRAYQPPVSAFRRPGGYAVALTYGPRAEWVQNVLAAGGCELEIGGRRVELGNSRVVRDPDRSLVPSAVAAALRLLGADQFLLLDLPGNA